MGDCRVEDLVDVGQKLVLVDFDLLCGLLDDDYFGIMLLEPACFGLDLEEPILVP